MYIKNRKKLIYVFQLGYFMLSHSRSNFVAACSYYFIALVMLHFIPYFSYLIFTFQYISTLFVRRAFPRGRENES